VLTVGSKEDDRHDNIVLIKFYGVPVAIMLVPALIAFFVHPAPTGFTNAAALVLQFLLFIAALMLYLFVMVEQMAKKRETKKGMRRICLIVAAFIAVGFVAYFFNLDSLTQIEFRDTDSYSSY